MFPKPSTLFCFCYFKIICQIINIFWPKRMFLKKFCPGDFLGLKTLPGPKISWARQKFHSNKFFCQIKASVNFFSLNFFRQIDKMIIQKMLVRKVWFNKIWSKTLSCLKKSWSKNIVAPKNCWSNWSQKWWSKKSLVKEMFWFQDFSVYIFG